MTKKKGYRNMTLDEEFYKEIKEISIETNKSMRDVSKELAIDLKVLRRNKWIKF